MNASAQASSPSRPYASSPPCTLPRKMVAGKYARYWNGSALSRSAQNGDRKSRGSIWPEMKKLMVLMTYRNEDTSRNQKAIVPMQHSKKKPMRKARTSEPAKAAKVSGSGQPGKKSRHRKNSSAYGSDDMTMYAALWAAR